MRANRLGLAVAQLLAGGATVAEAARQAGCSVSHASKVARLLEAQGATLEGRNPKAEFATDSEGNATLEGLERVSRKDGGIRGKAGRKGVLTASTPSRLASDYLELGSFALVAARHGVTVSGIYSALRRAGIGRLELRELKARYLASRPAPGKPSE